MAGFRYSGRRTGASCFTISAPKIVGSGIGPNETEFTSKLLNAYTKYLKETGNGILSQAERDKIGPMMQPGAHEERKPMFKKLIETGYETKEDKLDIRHMGPISQCAYAGLLWHYDKTTKGNHIDIDKFVKFIREYVKRETTEICFFG